MGMILHNVLLPLPYSASRIYLKAKIEFSPYPNALHYHDRLPTLVHDISEGAQTASSLPLGLYRNTFCTVIHVSRLAYFCIDAFV